MHDDLRAALGGAVAGAVATIPMSAVMFAADKMGLMGRHPPEVITTTGLEAAGGHPRDETKAATAIVGHVAFGAAAGVVFGLLYRHTESLGPPIARGIGYGLVVYTVSYAGWIPALNIMPSPPHDRPGRPSSMVAAHVVFGAALAVLVDWLVARRSDASPNRPGSTGGPQS